MKVIKDDSFLILSFAAEIKTKSKHRARLRKCFEVIILKNIGPEFGLQVRVLMIQIYKKSSKITVP